MANYIGITESDEYLEKRDGETIEPFHYGAPTASDEAKREVLIQMVGFRVDSDLVKRYD